jgi:phage antirepressor YoqD-like protein
MMENSNQISLVAITSVASENNSIEKWYSMSEAAKLTGGGMGRQKLYKLLRENKILMNSKEPYQKYINQQYFKYVLKAITDSNGKVLFHEPVILVSLKGILFIKSILEPKPATKIDNKDNQHQYKLFS